MLTAVPGVPVEAQEYPLIRLRVGGEVGAGSITISWELSGGVTADQVGGFRVRYRLENAEEWTTSPCMGRARRSCTIEGLQHGARYAWQVMARNLVGRGEWSDTRHSVTPVAPHDAPVWLSLRPSVEGIDVQFNPPFNDGGAKIVDYEVGIAHRNESGAPLTTVTVNTGPLTKVILTRDKRGVVYHLRLRARNGVGHGPWSETRQVRTFDFPRAPQLKELSFDGQHYLVFWLPPSDDGGAPVTAYEVRFIAAQAPDLSDINWTLRTGISASSRQYPLDDLDPTVEHLVQVRSRNGVGPSDWTQSARTTKLLVPAPPQNLEVSPAGTGRWLLTWLAPEDDQARPAVTRFELRAIDWSDLGEQDPPAQLLHVDDPEARAFSLVTPDPRTRWLLQVRAVNGIGASAWSRSRSTSAVPSAPFGLASEIRDSSLDVSWQAPRDPGRHPITRYELRYLRADAADGSETSWTEVSPAWGPRQTGRAAPLRYGITGLPVGVPFEIQLRAVSPIGPSPWSEALLASRGAPDAAPSIVRFEPGVRTLLVEWEPAATVAGAPQVNGFELQDITQDEHRSQAESEELGWTSVRSWPGDLTTSELSGLIEDEVYVVRVRAVNDDGPGPWSDHAIAPNVLVGAAPGRPAIAALWVAGSDTFVSWDDPSDADGGVITSYDLRYIRLDAQGDSVGRWTLVHDVSREDGRGYTLTGLGSHQRYELQVRALSVAGPGPWSEGKRTLAVVYAPIITRIVSEDDVPAIYWTGPAGIDPSRIDRYRVRYIDARMADNDDATWTEERASFSSRHLLRGLDPSVRYAVQVRAVGSGDLGPWSNTVFTSAQARPGRPTIDSVVRRGVTLLVSWTAPSEDGGARITQYDVRYIRADRTERLDRSWTVELAAWRAGSSPTSCKIIGVQEHVTFDVQVRAVNAVGVGPWSDTAGNNAPCLRGRLESDTSLVVAHQAGSVDDLAACAAIVGISSLHAMVGGEYVSLFVGAPPFVSAEFRETFSAGVPDFTPLLARRDQSAPAQQLEAWNSQELLVSRAWPGCLSASVATGDSLVLARGDSLAAFQSCVTTLGVATVFARQSDEWVSLTVGASQAENQEFASTFEDGIPALTPLYVRRDRAAAGP